MSDVRISAIPKVKGRHLECISATADTVANVIGAVRKVSINPGAYHQDEEDAPKNVQMLRRSFSRLSASIPITKFWRFVWAQEGEVKERQYHWARRIGAIRGHPSSWGFVRGRSCHDCCKSHLTYWGIRKPGELSLLSMDVENFFPSITGEMIEQAMSYHGFTPEEIEDCLSCCTIKVDEDILWNKILSSIGRAVSPTTWGGGSFSPLFSGGMGDRGHTGSNPDGARLTYHGKYLRSVMGNESNDNHPDLVSFFRELVFRYLCGLGRELRLGDRVLLQGSPASPAISNLVMKRNDYRLEAFAKACDAFYSRYADDITLSWKKRRGRKSIGLMIHSVKKILRESGLHLHPDKTIIKGPGMRQSLLGYNLNSGDVTVSRPRRHRVRTALKRMSSCGVDPTELRSLESLMGEVEFIATAHPDTADELRQLGREAMARCGVHGRTFISFGAENAHVQKGVVEDHEPRQLQIW